MSALVTVKCPHHWVIDEPAGERSVGRCQACGEEKSFSNLSPDVMETHAPRELSLKGRPKWNR